MRLNNYAIPLVLDIIPLVLDIIPMVWSLNNQNWTQAAKMEAILIPRHSLSASSELHPNRTLEMAEASKTWLLPLLEVMQEQLNPGVLKPGLYRYGTKSSSLFRPEHHKVVQL